MITPAQGPGRSAIERADAQAGTRDDAGTPGGWTLLWALLGGAVVWSVHLLVTYIVLAYACTTGWRSAVMTSVISWTSI